MANTTSNSRDVELKISATTSGNDQIKKLADEVDALAKKGGTAAPEFQKLAAELDKLATQDAGIQQLQKLQTEVGETATKLGAAEAKVKELGAAFEAQKTATEAFKTAQIAAREEVKNTEDKLREAKAELTLFRGESDQSARATTEYKTRLGELQKAVADLKVELENNKALAGTKSDLKDLEIETRKAERAFNAAQKEAAALQAQFTAQSTSTASITKALTDIGVETTDLADAQKKLADGVIATAAGFKSAADEQTKYEAKLANIAAKNDAAVASAQKLGNEIAAAAKQSAAAQVAAANDAEAAALRVKLAQEEVAAKAREAGTALENAFNVLNVKSAEAIKTEIEGVRTALATLANSGQLTGGQLKTAFETAEAKIASLSRELKGIPDVVPGASAALGVLRQSLSQLTAAFGAFELARGFIDAVNAVDNLKRSLTLLLGDAKLADQQIDFLRNTASNAGLSVGQLSKDFINFTASLNTSGISLEKQKDIFEATVNAAGQLGISTDRVGLILQAFAQTANKGKVTLEELQGQLGESLPGALAIAATGFGTTKEEVLKLVKSGVDADTFFTAFITGSQKAFGDGEVKITSFSAAWNRLKNAFTEFSQQAADTTAFKTLIAVIDGLATNFNAVATGAKIAAEAFLLFKFTDYVKGFTGLNETLGKTTTAKTALTGAITATTTAKAADTTATAANTTATVANTAAQLANKAVWAAMAADIVKIAPAKTAIATEAPKAAAALSAAAPSVGVFGTAVGGLLSLIGGLPGLFVLTALNAKTLGEGIADQVAKWTGLKDQIADSEQKIKAFDDAQKANTKSQQDAADKARIQQLAMAGLSEEAKKLVRDFDEVAKKTGSASAAIDDLVKNLRFEDLSGITSAVQALGRLQEEGKITGDKIRDIFAGASNNQDLALFETNVRTALIGVRGEAGLVKSLVEAIADESLKRVGSSIKEVETGFSTSFVKASNDTNALSDSLKTLGANATTTSTLLTKALDKEVEAAGTQTALDAVITKINAFAASGQLANTDVNKLFTDAIDKALGFAKTEEEIKKVKKILDEITAANPGVATSFEEAAKKIKDALEKANPALVQLKKDAELLGVTLTDSTKTSVENSLAAYERLKSSGKLSTDSLRDAFTNIAKTATEAAGGIIPEWVKVEAQYRNVDLTTIDLGRSIEQYGGAASQASGAAVIALGDAEIATNNLISATDALIAKEKERKRLQDERVELADNFLSVYNRLKSGGASDEQARGLAAKYFPNPGKGPSMQAILEANNRAGFGGYGNLSTAVAQDLSDLVRSGQLGKSPQQDNSNQLSSLKTEFQNLTRELADLKNKAAAPGFSDSVRNSAQSLFNNLSAGISSLNSFGAGVSPFTLDAFARNLNTYKSQASNVRTAVQAGPTSQAAPSTSTPSGARPSGSSGYTVTINLNGASRTINTASSADAQALNSLLQQIGNAANRSGPGGP